MMKSKKSSGLLDLDRDSALTQADVNALKRNPFVRGMDFANYLLFLQSIGDADLTMLRRKKSPGGSEPFDLVDPNRD